MVWFRTKFQSCNRLGPSLVVAALLIPSICIGAQSGVSVSGGPETTPTQVWGHERLGWDQEANSAVELANYVFTALIDGRFPEALEDVRCASTLSVAGYECSSRLPRMAPGIHTIELSSRIAADQSSSPLSQPLSVNLLSTAAEATATSARARVVVDGVSIEELRPERDLSGAVTLAALPGGRVLIGERGGRISMIDGGRSSEAAHLRGVIRGERLELLSLAVDPSFSETRAVIAAYASDNGLIVARFSEANGVLVNHAVLRGGLPAPPGRAAAAVAIGPDRKIYLAIGADSEDGTPVRDAFAARIIRMNLDGSTPNDDLPAPVFAPGMPRPSSISWSRDGQMMWVVGMTQDRLEARAVNFALQNDPGTTAQSYAVPATPLADGRAGVAGRAGELVVVAENSRSLLRLVSDSDGTINTIEWLLRNQFNGIRAIAYSPDGELWVCSDRGLFLVTFQR